MTPHVTSNNVFFPFHPQEPPLKKPPHIVVVDAHNPIGAEVARYAVAMGYEVTGITHTPPRNDEPWEVGVQWRSPETIAWDTLQADAVVWFSTDHPAIAHIRQVFVGQVPIAPQTTSQHEIWLDLQGPELPVEQIAMAALRAAVETERHGVLTRPEVAELGDAVMLQ